MKYLILSLLVTSCVTPEPPLPEQPEPRPRYPPRTCGTTEEVEQRYATEFDACWGTYKTCLKQNTESVCFPPHEQCVVKAYRKFLKRMNSLRTCKSTLFFENL